MIYFTINHPGLHLYEISKDGVVRNKKRLSECAQHKSSNNKGYLKLVLYKNGVRTNFELHRLLALTFIPNPQNKPTVNHIDGNPNNNNLSNLEWATIREQTIHAYKNKLAGGEKHGMSKLKNRDIKFIRQLSKDGLTGYAIAKKFKMSHSNIQRIIKGVYWKNVI